jgi:hypothetical protein
LGSGTAGNPNGGSAERESLNQAITKRAMPAIVTVRGLIGVLRPLRSLEKAAPIHVTKEAWGACFNPFI